MIKLDFCFKGERTYVHGTDIFDKSLEHLPLEPIHTKDLSIEIVFHGVASKNLNLIADQDLADNVDQENLKSTISLRSGEQDLSYVLVQDHRPITCTLPYREEDIIEASHLNLPDKSIEIKKPSDYSLIEQAVAMNKELLKNLFPEAPGKWYFTKIKLRGIDLDKWLNKEYKFTIKFRKNLGFKLTDSLVYADGNRLGNIYFSLS